MLRWNFRDHIKARHLKGAPHAVSWSSVFLTSYWGLTQHKHNFWTNLLYLPENVCYVILVLHRKNMWYGLNWHYSGVVWRYQLHTISGRDFPLWSSLEAFLTDDIANVMNHSFHSLLTRHGHRIGSCSLLCYYFFWNKWKLICSSKAKLNLTIFHEI